MSGLLGVEVASPGAPQPGKLTRFFADMASGPAGQAALEQSPNRDRLAQAIDRNHLLLIHGSKSVTEVREEVAQLAKAANVPVRHVDLSLAASPYDFIGRWVGTPDGGVAFRDGPVTEALRNGEWLVVTGLDSVPRQLTERLGFIAQETADGQRYMVVMEANNDVVPFHGAGRVIGVVKGTGESPYAGRELQPVLKDLSRWQPVKWQSPP